MLASFRKFLVALLMVSGVALVMPAVAHADVSAVPPEQPLPSSAPLTDAQRATLNSQIAAVDGALIPDSVTGVTISQDKVTFVDAAGSPVAVPPSSFPIREGVIDEIKRAVGACLGINFTANVSAWTAIQNSVNTWDKAAKFVIRRVGWFAALTCGGGILREYLL